MNIVVPIKQVPETDEMRYDPATRTLVREGVELIINAFDKRSLTEAMRLRSAYGGSVTAITMGPPQAREAMVECLGRGVDLAIHITDRVFAGSDTLATARTLARAIGRLSFDLLLLGKTATDAETGQVGPELAELLGLPHVTGVTSIEPTAEGALVVTRETDFGSERVECPLPALLTASERLIKPVKTTPALVEEGRRRLVEDPALIETLSAHDLGIEPAQAGLSGSPTQVLDLRPMMAGRERRVFEGDPDAAARALLALIHGRRGRSAPADGREAVPLTRGDKRAAGRTGRSVWAVAEWLPGRGGEPACLRRVSLELISEAAWLAAQTGGEAVAVLIGHGVEGLAAELSRYEATSVLLADHPTLGDYDPETYAWMLAKVIREREPWAVLLPSTSFGRDLAPRVAARLGLGLTADCLGLEIDDEGRLVQLKPAFGGQVVAPIVSRTLPQMTTIRPGILGVGAPSDPTEPNIVRLNLDGLPEPRVRTLSRSAEGEQGMALDNARLVVCVGAGIGGPEALGEVRALADALGQWMGFRPEEVAIGGSRKVIDNGWLPWQQQIGITGHAVAPDLYLGLGVRGTFNHVVGFLRARTVAAANTDPAAPIFDSADIGAVTGWREFTESLKRAMREG